MKGKKMSEYNSCDQFCQTLKTMDDFLYEVEKNDKDSADPAVFAKEMLSQLLPFRSWIMSKIVEEACNGR
jgi:hypothetical protein